MPHAASGSPSNLWWAADVGPCRVVTLCSYCSTAAGSLQLAWLEKELAAVDRRRTPWLVVMMHAPWYAPWNTFTLFPRSLRPREMMRAPL